MYEYYGFLSFLALYNNICIINKIIKNKQNIIDNKLNN